MNINQAQSVLRDLVDVELPKALNGSAITNASIEVAVQRLAQVSGSGISPERMPSTRALANEIQRFAVDNHRRILALIEGVREIIG